MVNRDIKIKISDVLSENYEAIMEEIIWEGAKETSERYDIEVGTEEFFKIYETIKKGYDYSNSYSTLLSFLSLSAIESLIETDTVALINVDMEDNESIKNNLVTIARVFYGTLNHLLMTSKAFNGKLFINNFDESFTDSEKSDIEFVFTFKKADDTNE
jgi:hypothetical protein